MVTARRMQAGRYLAYSLFAPREYQENGHLTEHFRVAVSRRPALPKEMARLCLHNAALSLILACMFFVAVRSIAVG